MRAARVVVLMAGLLGVAHAQTESPRISSEVRALWVTRGSLRSPDAIAEMVAAATNGGFNTLIVQVRGRGDAYYRSGLEPRATELATRPGFDPLAETIQRARPAGLRVHAWVAVNLVSSAVDLPRARQHVINRHPEWLMIPKELAGDLRRVNVRSADYVGRLARWTRARPGEVEGLYVSPIHPAAVSHAVAVVSDIVSQYPIHGVHLDYARFPNEDFDYSAGAIAQFKSSVQADLSPPERSRLEALETADPLAYTSFFPERWTAFRQARLTDAVARLRAAVKALKPDVLLSAAVFPDSDAARAGKLQDWPAWLQRSLIDALCPMAYTQDVALFEQQIAAAQGLAGGVHVWAGVGAYRLTRDATLAHIAAARRQKAAGVVLFSYDALVTPPHSRATLTQLGRAAFGSAMYP
jgi:uncharacterized lipoprotein YddW (UPF0748 family)